jgi:hypothetical protein
MAAARVIWPHLFERNIDLTRKYQAAAVVHSGVSGNVIKLGGGYFAAPFAAGAIDMESVALRNDPPLRVWSSLAEARRHVD